MICAQCGANLGHKVKRCYECGACEDCCICDGGPDCEGFDGDTGGFDRDELGEDPEED